jgi:hypothetical protein
VFAVLVASLGALRSTRSERFSALTSRLRFGAFTLALVEGSGAGVANQGAHSRECFIYGDLTGSG